MTDWNELEITQLLRRHHAGDPEALHQLLPYLYDELKRLARRWVSTGNPSWEPAALVNEMFLRLFDGTPPHWNDRQHFFNTASLQMRHILLSAARRKHAEKRGGGALLLSLDEALQIAEPELNRLDLLALDEALQALAQAYPRPAQIVGLRFYLGFSLTEVALALELNERTVRRDWDFAKSWLLDYLQPRRG